MLLCLYTMQDQLKLAGTCTRMFPSAFDKSQEVKCSLRFARKHVPEIGVISSKYKRYCLANGGYSRLIIVMRSTDSRNLSKLGVRAQQCKYK